MKYKTRGKTFVPTSEKRNYILMCNNCNNCCGSLFNLLFGTSRNGCGCNNCNNGCWRSSCGCQNNHNCGCIDEYYAAQYGLNTNCCGRSDWFSCRQSGCGCNSCWNNNRSGCGCNSCWNNNRSGCGSNSCWNNRRSCDCD